MSIDADALLKTTEPLEEASKFVQHLHQLGCRHVSGYVLAADVYLRKVREN